VMARREFAFSNLNKLDRLFLLVYAYVTIVFLLRSNEGLAYQIGLAVDASFCYFIFRGLIADVDDFRWFLRAFVFLLIPYVAILAVEMRTTQNLFHDIGRALVEQDFRAGRLRCLGSFRHPALLGTLGGSFLPLYIALVMAKKDRKWGLIGIVLCAAIVFLSNSGGPVAAVAVGISGWTLWSMRTKMRLVRRWMLGLLVLAALVMEAPVWYLPARISDHLGVGGDSWHRSHLMEMAAQDIGKWWLWGMPVADTEGWFPYKLAATLGGSDITNQYLSLGVAGGLLSMILFIVLLVKCFKSLGGAMGIIRASPNQAETEFMLWGLGVMLVVHIENWFAISYFDQTYVMWFMQLAAVVSIVSQISFQYNFENAKSRSFLSFQPVGQFRQG